MNSTQFSLSRSCVEASRLGTLKSAVDQIAYLNVLDIRKKTVLLRATTFL